MTSDPSLVSRIQALKRYSFSEAFWRYNPGGDRTKWIRADDVDALVIDPPSLQKKDETKNEDDFSARGQTATASTESLTAEPQPAGVTHDERTEQ